MNDDPSIETFDTPDAWVLAAAAVISEQLRQAIAGGLRASFVATGGATPAPVYRRLGHTALDWSRVAVTLSDERWVDPASPESNERMVRETLLDGLAAAAGFTPLWSADGGPERAAAAAEPAIAALEPFDVALLGMGEDGHVASLFPGSPALAQGLDPDGGRLCIAVPAGSPAPSQPRISLTLAALLRARLVVLLISGEAKRRTLQSALDGADLPVRALLAQRRAPVRILCSA